MGVSRRKRAEGGRPHQVSVQFSDEEWELIKDRAARDELATRAWIGDAAVKAAVEGRREPLPVNLALLRGELGDGRRLLRNVGGNLNDLARAANISGEVGAEVMAVLGLVSRAVQRLDETVDQVVEAARVVDRSKGARRQRKVRPPRATPLETRPSVAARARHGHDSDSDTATASDTATRHGHGQRQ